jgi:hypothetical protein
VQAAAAVEQGEDLKLVPDTLAALGADAVDEFGDLAHQASTR